MPGSRRVLWDKRPARSRQPFSYVKACRLVETVVFVTTIIVATLVDFLTDFLSGYSNFVVVGSLMAETIALMLILEHLVWKVLPPHIRARIPYDSAEALQNKVDIRSYTQLANFLVGSGG
jgi:hypothetical protein